MNCIPVWIHREKTKSPTHSHGYVFRKIACFVLFFGGGGGGGARNTTRRFLRSQTFGLCPLQVVLERGLQSLDDQPRTNPTTKTAVAADRPL